MKTVLKTALSWVVAIFIIIYSSIGCKCYDTVSGLLDVPSQVVKGKSFTASLQVECNSSVGVVMFTLTHSSEIEYKDCKVNDGSCGYIEKSYSNNTLSVIYINTQGITATNATNLVDVTFKADDSVTTADIQIYTSNGASSDEVMLTSDNGREYSIDIVENVTDNQSASGASVQSSASSSSSGKNSSAMNKEIPNNAEQATLLAQKDEATTNNTITLATKSESKLLLVGAVFVVAVAVVVAVSYKAGRRAK